MKKRISVIVPVLNEQKLIQSLSEQLLLLSRQGIEIVVVDGGSSDGTLDCLKSLSNDHQQALIDQLLISPPGRAKQMNLGAQHATGDILWFLHCDSVLGESLIHDMKQTCGLWGWCDIKLAGSAKIFRLIEYMMNSRAQLTKVATGDQGLFVERRLFNEVGCFQDIALMEDVALSKMLRAKSKPVVLKARITSSSRRWQKAGVWRTILLMWRLRWAYFRGVDPAKLALLYKAKG